MSASQLTEAAEQLVGPYTFMIANKVAKQALEKDPANLKAQFLVKLLERFEAFRGIHTRMRSYLKADQLKKHDQWFRNFPDSPMKKFLSEPGKPIKTVSDMQDIMTQYYNSIVEFRKFLKENQNSELEIQLNANVFEQHIKQEMYDSCQTYEDNKQITVECDYSGIAKKKLNSSDFITLRQMVSGEIIQGLFVTGYSLEGAEQLEDKVLSNQQKAEILTNTKTFGLLRKNHNFNLLKEIGSDLSASMKWAIQYQKNLCPQGTLSTNQRRGYLFDTGICVDGNDDEVKNFMSVLDRALGGVTQVDMEKEDGSLVKMNVNLFAWSTNPIRNLRQVAPTKWNDCDLATSLQDNTLGGIFVDNNVPVVMKTQCN